MCKDWVYEEPKLVIDKIDITALVLATIVSEREKG